MKTIIAGSRKIMGAYEHLLVAIHESGFEITEVIGGEGGRADAAGKRWALAHEIPFDPNPAPWKDLKAPGAVVKYGQFGPYNALAGLWRNEIMACKGEALIALWDGWSDGTRDMIKRALAHELYVFIYKV